MQLGFVIDHSRCIGCHACTVACKAENDVPLGSFRTWVKYTERGSFPEVKRSFAVLRCNQCSSAPCVGICPVKALDKRPDGIVDVDPARCIGCKACMQACPYDALYIHPGRGTAEKCHFCAHRTELGLAPACAIVCPTEAIVPGDFDDPASRVSRMKSEGDLTARKVEAGTGPNVWYREVAEAGIDPLETNTAGGYLWANQTPGPQLDAQTFEALEQQASARTVYDVEHAPLWAGKVSAYLFTKSLAAGAFLAGALLMPPLSLAGATSPTLWSRIGGLALLFLLVTTVLLVADLKRPERFLYILRYANWGSWLARGTLVLAAFGALTTAWVAAPVLGLEGAPWTGALVGATAVAAVLTAAYTAWLFRQARGRVLWMRRGMALSLVVHALLAGSALLLLAASPLGLDASAVGVMRVSLAWSLAAQLALTLAEGKLAPRGRENEYHRAARLVTRGPYARRHWLGVIVVGTLVPLGLLFVPGATALWSVAAAAGLVGLWIEQDTLVRAGQALPIS